ncbi:MAG: translation initiation factor IF-2 [Candidatus Babeliaceae bacterium]
MIMRVYEFSKQHDVPNKDLIELLHKNGFDIASHMSVLSDQALDFLKQHFKKPAKSAEKAVEKVSQVIAEPVKTAIESQPKVKPPLTSASEKIVPEIKEVLSLQPKPAPQKLVAEEKRLAPSPQAKVNEVAEIIAEPMTVSDFAYKTHKSVSEIILTLLKQGIVANKNQIISEKVVNILAQQFGIKIAQPIGLKSEKIESIATTSAKNEEPRLPIVVVIGHVDHGKTTLLDFIRKTRVAAKEKGGITQHIGAYEATTPQGNLVFLDTPGHEAFSMMRIRGLKVADIAILVVAGDDGVMPQTIEAIKLAQSIGLPIIVAVNKIDKATPQQLEAVKRGLAQHNIICEEWGGQTSCIPISAKLGTGVDTLLEMVILQAQLMDLTASIQVPAQGFILESKLEKGRGPVATVICQNGILHVGDYFIAGSVRGKVSSLVDSYGNRIKEVHPSIPVQVAGFAAMPHVGDIFEVVSSEESKTRAANYISPSVLMRQTTENALNLIIKTDGTSSKEALLAALAKMTGKVYKELYIVYAGIGPILESDILLAHDTGAIIYGLHVKLSATGAAQAQQMRVTIKLFDVIYKLLEDVALVAEQGKPVKKVVRKIGEALVLKVFDIKNLGIIAGAIVREGRFVKNGSVVIWRGKTKVGQGDIKSLQRERKIVKEVHKGFECGFMVDGFDDWHVDDRVECFAESEA